MKLQLIRPSIEFKRQVLDYRQEFIDYGEKTIDGGNFLNEINSFDDWLRHIEANSSKETVMEKWVVSTTFLAVTERNELAGIIDVRHSIDNPFLQTYGGHIGYSVRPSMRRQGYATEMLRLALEYCKTIGLNKVMLGCFKDNTASKKTIIKNGGVKTREFVSDAVPPVEIYWIELN